MSSPNNISKDMKILARQGTRSSCPPTSRPRESRYLNNSGDSQALFADGLLAGLTLGAVAFRVLGPIRQVVVHFRGSSASEMRFAKGIIRSVLKPVTLDQGNGR